MTRYKNMESWMLTNRDKTFRYLVYKKVYTPHEQQKAYMDESEYENGGYYSKCKIEEAIDLGGDWLLGMRILEDDNEKTGILHYVRLNEIRLSCFENDQEGYEEADETDDEYPKSENREELL